MEDLADAPTEIEASELEGRVNKYFLIGYGSLLGLLLPRPAVCLLLADVQARAMDRGIQGRGACLSLVNNLVVSMVSTHQ